MKNKSKTITSVLCKTARLRRAALVVTFFASTILLADCKKANTPSPAPTPTGEVAQWLTRADQSILLQKQTNLLPFVTDANTHPGITIDDGSAFQRVEGFGYTLTGASAFLIQNMVASEKTKLLNELFGKSETSIGISYLRISLGASDLSPYVFSYNDLPAGQTDETLAQFSLAADTLDLIPLLREILAINPAIKLLASPWSPPVWMKDNGSTVGGSLQPKYYAVYAQYFVKYLQAMKARGIAIDAVTVQNEPQHGGNNPSMVMSAVQQADFVKNHLGPAFRAAGITTKIIIWDHNCDNPGYPISILNDAGAKQFIAGSAFHLYAGDISALSAVKNAHPDKDLYFTEQWTGSKTSFDGDLKWHIRNVIIGSMLNWSVVALEWNLANNPLFGPHTPGGCTECKGALTIDGSAITRNVSYYIVAHASKFVPAGSVRIASNGPGNLPSVAFKTPEGKKVLIVLNDGSTSQTFNIKYNAKWAVASLAAGTVATYTW
jgi:glucosylceramidase